MDYKAELLPYLIAWVVVIALLVVRSATGSKKGAGLVLSYCFQMWLLYWVGALFHCLPWTDLPQTDFTVFGFTQSTYALLSFAAGCLFIAPIFSGHLKPSSESFTPDRSLPRAYIIGHWNYAPGTKKNVYIVSSADKVELFVNGKSLGFGEQSTRFLFTFKDVEWRPGTVSAVGYDAGGKEITETWKKTAGKPAAVRLTGGTGPQGLHADGADLALVDVEVVDADGNRCPTALNLINFSLSGPAKWRGGIAQGPDNYILSRSLPVENGVNRVIIRSTTNAGKIVLSANANGLKSATVEIVSRPIKVMDGLSLEMPDAGLRPNLERGPTPAGPSFTVSRRAVHIARATAGANEDQAAKSFDDDETTEWASDGKIANGWIKYDFAQPASVGEVTLKLTGWRTQSYPIRVLVDDKVVFAGATPRSLGYVTFTFPPVMGASLKIELAGSAGDRDAFGNIIEIPGTLDPQSSAGKSGAKSTLSIVEIEIYEPHRYRRLSSLRIR